MFLGFVDGHSLGGIFDEEFANEIAHCVRDHLKLEFIVQSLVAVDRGWGCGRRSVSGGIDGYKSRLGQEDLGLADCFVKAHLIGRVEGKASIDHAIQCNA
jgi:hypothetical protein